MTFSSSSSYDGLFCFLLVWILVGGLSVHTATGATTKAGINYGRKGKNLPPPIQVAAHLHSLGFTKVRIYDADPDVLAAFANTSTELTIGIGNELVLDIAAGGSPKAEAWLKQHVLPFLPRTRITGIIVGNEVYSGNNTSLKSSLLPALKSVHGALVALGLHKKVTTSTTHAINIIEPVSSHEPSPSTALFRQEVTPYMIPLLDFLSRIDSPFLLNTYPFFSYKADPDPGLLCFCTFEPLFPGFPGYRDPKTNLTYDNLLYAQIDSVYAAMNATGHPDINVIVTETGWPTQGDANEFVGGSAVAGFYNGNLLQRVAINQATPMKPSVPVAVYISSLFNEDLKPGPNSERNYGLVYPSFKPVYNWTHAP